MLITFHHLFKGTNENQIHYRAQCALHEGNIEMRNQKRMQRKKSNLFETMNSFLFDSENKRSYFHGKTSAQNLFLQNFRPSADSNFKLNWALSI